MSAAIAGKVAPKVDGVQKKFAAMRSDMNASLIERTEEIDIVLTALVCNHHPLLVGEPGTAKSVLGRTVAEWLEGEPFEYLLNKFTDPSELFGPVSIKAYKAGKYERITENTLVTAQIAFLDEFFKGSSAIQNTVLGILNERRYKNGTQVVKVPLIMAIAASNEFPSDADAGGSDNGSNYAGHSTGKELGAIFDRFLFRKIVQPVASPEGLERLLFDADLTPKLSTRITPDEVAAARDQAKSLAFSDEAKDTLLEILRELAKEGILPGDRRKRWSVEAVRGYSFLLGANRVEKEHLEILAHTLWYDPREQPAKAGKIVATLSNPVGLEAANKLAEAKDALVGMDFRRLESVLATTSKLEAVHKDLEKLGKNNPRVQAAMDYVSKKLTKIRADLVKSGKL